MSGKVAKIESLDLTIEDLFKDFYSVPDFQREYVWERREVEKLLQDVLDEFYDEEGALIRDTEYFLGSVVVCNDPNGTYALIDGQQRMTTIYLLLCAVRDLLKEIGTEPNAALLGQIADVAVNDDGEDVHRHRLQLLYEDSRGIVTKLVEDPEAFHNAEATTVSVKRIRAAYQDILEFLRVNFDSSPKKLRRFYATFTKRVKLIRIKTPSLTNALKVFETVNDRGVGLNAMDLLKNLLFMKTDGSQYGALKLKWKDLVDTLDRAGEKPLRFLRYYILSHHEIDTYRPPREDDIYDWFVANGKKCGIDDEPMVFLETLVKCAQAWAQFAKARDAHGTQNTYLRNLSMLSGAARQHFILLLAGRHLSSELFAQLCASIENLFFCYIITREPTKMFERNFSVWSRTLRIVTDGPELQAFIADKITSDLRGRRSAFDFSIRELDQGRIQQYRMRYILSKLAQFVQRITLTNAGDVSLDEYAAKAFEIEHILPQNPDPDFRDTFDKTDEYDEYVAKLGNLTLLEKTINSSISNGEYTAKLPAYKQSSLVLTRSLAELPHVGVNTQVNRAAQALKCFDCWTSKEIEKRQEMLVSLAALAWGMPAEK